MKTVTYILRSEPDRALRDAGPMGRGLPAERDKVVDLAVWKAEHQMDPDGPETDAPPVRHGDREPVRRRRWTAADWAELAATLAVAAAFLALAARVLLF